MMYGNYDLRRGDRDSNHTYGGVVRSAVAGEVLPPPGGPGLIQQLQQDLIELGFRLVGAVDGIFGRKTEWAVREFQIYSKMKTLAAETGSAPRYVDRLTAVLNTLQYLGPVSGVVTADTRTRQQQWLTNSWRCPVVVEVWKMAGRKRSSLHHENIWWHDDVTEKPPMRMFVRDFTNYYDFPAEHDPNDLIVLGRHKKYVSWSGPLSEPPHHTWPNSELLPEALIGTNLGALTPAQRSTYKVVRAVSEVECIGFFDCLNAYDNAFVSGGPCHWTLGIVSGGSVDEGELCGYIAYLRYADNAAFDKAISFFGVRIDEDWVSAGFPNGRTLFERVTRKYVGWIALQQQDGTYRRLPEDEELANYFKSWHWFYRFVMAGRTIEGWRRRMWDMARVRLRDIISTPYPAGVIADIPDGNGGARRATVGDVYTSERALAILLRWHIRFPGYVIAGGQAGSRLRSAFSRAAIPDSAGPPAGWTDTHERQLLDGLTDEIASIGKAELDRTIAYVRNWPEWAGGAKPRRFRLSPQVGNP